MSRCCAFVRMLTLPQSCFCGRCCRLHSVLFRKQFPAYISYVSGSPFGPGSKSKASYTRLSHAHPYGTRAPECNDFVWIKKIFFENSWGCRPHWVTDSQVSSPAAIRGRVAAGSSAAEAVCQVLRLNDRFGPRAATRECPVTGN